MLCTDSRLHVEDKTHYFLGLHGSCYIAWRAEAVIRNLKKLNNFRVLKTQQVEVKEKLPIGNVGNTGKLSKRT